MHSGKYRVVDMTDLTDYCATCCLLSTCRGYSFLEGSGYERKLP